MFNRFKSREETMDLLEREIGSGEEVPNRMIGALTQKTKLLEQLIEEIKTQLNETEKRLATVSTDQISLRAKFTEMAREFNAPPSSQ